MKATADRNLRRGARAEDLGVLMLSSFCAVAQVPREQDVGVDVVATLLRPDGSRRLVAEDSVFVQIKAASKREVVIDESGVDWLYEQRLPLFIGSVDLDAGRMELFTLHLVSRTLLEGRYRQIVVHLGGWPPDVPVESDGVRHVPLFRPVLAWTLQDMADPEWPERAYRIVQAWSRIELQNIATRRIGRFQPAQWAANEVPVVSDGTMIFGSPQRTTQNARYVLREMQPWIETLALHVATDDDPRLAALVAALLAIQKESGEDPDPSGALGLMLALSGKGLGKGAPGPGTDGNAGGAAGG